jgi:cytochrome c peroxidase
VGGVSAPTVMNSAYSPLQFWDGRAASLEDQSQGPPQNDVEMWDGKDHAWNGVVRRIRAEKNHDYNAVFKQIFGTLPTRDAAAKAIATYERTVLSGNAVHDRAELAMRQRVAEEGGTDFTLTPADYETVLKDAAAKKDAHALDAFGLTGEQDAAKFPELAKSISNGRALFFGKARCNSCHAGDNFTDNLFHNIGVGADKDGHIKPDASRYNALPTGHKNPEAFGAFKTPTCRGLLQTAPYLHNGSEKTLADVIEFYDRGGNINPFLDTKMRDLDAEKAYLTLSKEKFQELYGKKYPEVKIFNGRPIIPLKLELTAAEKKDLENFLRALNGDAIPPIVADPQLFPGATPTARN